MAKSNWEFSSSHPWQEFAESFRHVVGNWKPNTSARIAGLKIQFSSPSDSNGVFDDLDRSSGITFDAHAGLHGRNGQTPSDAHLTLEETAEGGSHGLIQFSHALGGAGKELGELTQRSVRAVDSAIRF